MRIQGGTLLGGRGGEAATCLDYDAGAEPNRDDFERRSNRCSLIGRSYLVAKPS
jgi:hypothetical protein